MIDVGDKEVLNIGSASLENIQTSVGVLKRTIKTGRKVRPTVVVYKTYKGLQVGLEVKESKKPLAYVNESDILIQFSENSYHIMARRTENVAKIARVIQKNAKDKEKQLQASNRIPYEEYEDLLYNIGDFLEEDNSLNLVYNQGVGSFDAYDYIHVEDMVEAVRAELVNDKKIKGIQIRGIPRVQLYISVSDYNKTSVSFSYLGEKDNIYDTFDWNGKDNLKDIINNKYDEAKFYDSKLKTSKLDKDVGGYTPKTVAQKSVMNMSDDDYKEVLEDY